MDLEAARAPSLYDQLAPPKSDAKAAASLRSKVPIHLRGRLPAPPPEKSASFLGDYGAKTKPVPAKKREMGMHLNLRAEWRAAVLGKTAADAAGAAAGEGEQKRLGDREQSAPPRMPHAGEEGKKIAADAIEAELERLRRIGGVSAQGKPPWGDTDRTTGSTVYSMSC